MDEQRRLAAILAADMVGYSRKMGEDEAGTLAALTSHLSEMIEPCITEHRGRIFKSTGDGWSSPKKVLRYKVNKTWKEGHSSLLTEPTPTRCER